ncbi:MAG: sugar ABC transporter ATP-binding protein [Spirochaetes bacterium]|uniref:Sugar ABC transporter ATP-binding protein n=1 Tax=Candidatus Ornithospirochaeta stercoripullorum TaxID=2840899 RepID=A0A9D9E0N9_9SPIO|nr:sugar ABC transporter ATP-binding protein [Candidatus Ornithospirochaeta stercoripullorum]
MQKGKVIVEGRNLVKKFNDNVVLNDVSITCREGEAIALVGENGAGKTTLMNMISGGLKPTSGQILVDGKEVKFTSSLHARQLGISFVHQELSLLDEMTVGENIMISIEQMKGIFLDQKAIHTKAEEILKATGFDIDVNRMAGDLSPAERQIVEIAKAYASSPRLMIFDEPTSSLNQAESNMLFDFIGKLKESGVSVIMISHRMDDIFATCDTAFVLKDGEFVFSTEVSKTSSDELISKMVGREFKAVYPPRSTRKSDKIRISLKNVSVGNAVKNVSFDVPEGKIVGIGGLEGQGQRELCRALFGIERFTSGTYSIDGEAVKLTSPHAAIKKSIAFVPEDRKTECLVLPLSVEENISALILNKVNKFGVIRKRLLDEEVQRGIDELKIKVQSPLQLVMYLSGGNQQKVVFSKWIKTNPRILYLQEPTRGVDVQSKLEIYALIRSLTENGVSVVLFTSDMLELIGLSDEIYVMYEGQISGHISGEEATEEKIMQFCTGINQLDKEIVR